MSSEGDAIHLVVRDRGIGLTPDELERLFRRYARATGAVEQGAQSLGLGLYLSKGIIDAHGGRIWAESAGARRRDQAFCYRARREHTAGPEDAELLEIAPKTL